MTTVMVAPVKGSELYPVAIRMAGAGESTPSCVVAEKLYLTGGNISRAHGGILMGLVRFLASPVGRVVRIVLGAIIIVVGVYVIGDLGGLLVALIGVVPLAAGMGDFCLLAPLFGLPFSGKDLRGQIAHAP
jgi:hypothetical protein